MKTGAKIITIVSVVAALALAAFIYIKFFFVFGEGIKTGQLNQVVYKGWIWKTYEGRIIQAGFKGAQGGGSIQSNTFDFSVDPAIADSLMKCGGMIVDLGYKEYLGRLPWRGMQKYIVTEIQSVRPSDDSIVVPIVGEE